MTVNIAKFGTVTIPDPSRGDGILAEGFTIDGSLEENVPTVQLGRGSVRRDVAEAVLLAARDRIDHELSTLRGKP